MMQGSKQPWPPQARSASIVILVVMVGWMILSWAGGWFGWPVRFAFLADFAAMAALIWSLVVLVQVWRKQRHRNEDT